MPYRIKKLLQPLLILLLIGVVVFFAMRSWRNYQDGQESGLPGNTERENGICSIFYHNSSTELSFQLNEEGVWYWTENPAFPLDTAKLQELAKLLQAIEPAAIGSVEEETLGDYGLSSPAYTVTYRKEDGTSVSMEIGSQISSGAYYMKYADDSALYTISPTLVTPLMLGIYDRMLLPTLPILRPEQIQTVTLEDEVTTIYTVRPSDAGCEWYLGSARVSGDETVQAMQQGLTTLTIDACILWNPLEEALALCGLDEENVVTVTIDYLDDGGAPASLTLLLGTQRSENSYYLRLAGDSTVYGISPRIAQPLLTLAK